MRMSLSRVLIISVLFAAMCIPLILVKGDAFSFDEATYYVPSVKQIEKEWPSLNIARDSLSATPPGYQYFLASVLRVLPSNLIVMRVITWFVSLAVLLLLSANARRFVGELDSVLFILPLLLSNFFVKSAVRVVTDNPSLLLVTACMLSALRREATPKQRLGSAVLSGGATFIRQTNVWTAVLPLATSFPHRWRDFGLKNLLILVPSVAPLAVVALLFQAWGGLVPGPWRELSIRWSLTGPVYLLSVYALWGFFYMLPMLRSEFRDQWRRILLWLAVGMLAAWFAETDPNKEAGRWGGYLWAAADFFPQWGHHNLLFIMLCGLGAVVVYSLNSALIQSSPAEARLFLLANVAWAATFVIGRQVFHRYFEPTVLVLLILCSSVLARDRRVWRRGLFLAAAVQLSITLYTTYRPAFS